MSDAACITTVLVRLAFGTLFLAAGVSKLLRMGSVQHVLAGYGLLPKPMLPCAALALAVAEVVAGLLLLLSFFLPVHDAAWTLTAGLLTLFSIAVLVTLARGITVPCGCTKLLNGHVVTWSTLGRNLLLLSLLLLDHSTQNGGSL
jgi:uncharacterized membrane protein YphA (DoxX/SURF4 family)